MAWYRELPIGFDLETTGTDPRGARIVTEAVTEVRDGRILRAHAISDERAAAECAPAHRAAFDPCASAPSQVSHPMAGVRVPAHAETRTA